MGVEVTPYPRFAGTSPKGGRFADPDLPPLGEVARSAEGGLVSRNTPSPNPLPQGGEGLSALALSLWERVG